MCYPLCLAICDPMVPLQHYYETHLLLQEAICQVAAAFAVDPQRIVPLQLRPDERVATASTIWTFTYVQPARRRNDALCSFSLCLERDTRTAYYAHWDGIEGRSTTFLCWGNCSCTSRNGGVCLLCQSLSKRAFYRIRDISLHDLLGQMREMFERSRAPLGEWRFGSRKVLLQPHEKYFRVHLAFGILVWAAKRGHAEMLSPAICHRSS